MRVEAIPTGWRENVICDCSSIMHPTKGRTFRCSGCDKQVSYDVVNKLSVEAVSNSLQKLQELP